MTTKIEWTDETWNPVTGCTKVSQGCHFCYAERLWPKVEGSRVKREGGAQRAFTDVRCHPDRLDAPLRWRTPRRVFVNSMSDLFHEDVPDEFIAQVWRCMAWNQRHIFQILTKRPQRMLEWVVEHGGNAVFAGEREEHENSLKQHGWPLRNVWLGVSVEDQATTDERIPLLLQTPAAIRFVSYEPALGPINLGWYLGRFDPLQGPATPNLHWLIAGGESGPHARPSHPDWFRSVRDQCDGAGVAFFFKQWGEHLPGEFKKSDNMSIVWQDGRREWYGDHADIKYSDSWLTNDADRLVISYRVGKKKAGRLLDGREHNEYPA